MAVDVEVCVVAVHALAHVIRQPAHRENVARAIQRKPVIEVEALPARTFSWILFEPTIVSLEWNAQTLS